MRIKMKLFVVVLLLFIGIVILVSGCSNSKAIKVGANFELSGPLAMYGVPSLNGVKLAIKQVNKDGGILGQEISLVIKDNCSDVATSSEVTREMIKQDKVVAILGAASSSATFGIVPVAQDSEIPFMTTWATVPRITVQNDKVNEYAFRACFIDPFQGVVLANYAVEKMGFKTAILYIDSNTEYSKSLGKAFAEKFQKNGGQVLAEYSYNSSDKNFPDIQTITKIAGLNPQLLFLPGLNNDAGVIIKYLREIGADIPVFSGDALDSDKMLEIAGAQALNRCYFTDHFYNNPSDPYVASFSAAYVQEYGIEPDSSAALGYDAAMMMANAIKRSHSATPVAIKNALAEIKNYKGVTGIISINSKHNAQKNVNINEYVNGKKIFIETFFVL